MALMEQIVRARTILVVEDDPFIANDLKNVLGDRGLNAVIKSNMVDAKAAVETEQPAVAILDIRIKMEADDDPSESHWNATFGLELARWIRANHPKVRIVGHSLDGTHNAWFERHGSGFFLKSHEHIEPLGDFVARLAACACRKLPPRVFIVHGHDHTAKLELKNFLQNRLRLPEPIVLHEQATQMRTLIEKFEQAAAQANLVFVLMTPDDVGAVVTEGATATHRARQNVIFELGYFLGRMGRRSGRVILLHKGDVDLPSDLAGILSIDITDGIDAAGEQIRTELQDWLDVSD
jgi:CheY-like chemotaxis protein